MVGEYDLYQRMLEGSLDGRGFARGLERARETVGKLSPETGHECFVVYLPTTAAPTKRSNMTIQHGSPRSGA
jgi:hypothetical protein